MAKSNNKYNIRVIDRALRILNSLSDSNPRTLTKISNELNLDNSTTFRILSTLLSNDYIKKDEKTGEYQIGAGVLKLSQAYFGGNDIRYYASSDLEELRNSTSETVHLGVLDNMKVIYLEKLHGLHSIGYMSSLVGGQAPSYCTGIGKILLSYQDEEKVRDFYFREGLIKYTDNTIIGLNDLIIHLKEIREKGFALDEGEHEADVRCVAAPIFDITNSVVAAISVSGPKSRLDPISEQKKIINETVSCSKNISTKLGMNF